MADIAINPVTRRVQFTGNTGTGPFAFTFNVLQQSDIVVYKNNVELTLTTDYTVSLNANGTGSVTLVTALVATDVLVIVGGRELSRTTDFVTAGDLLASSLNEQLDSNVIMSQQLDERVSRTIRSQPGDELKDLYIPLKADRADKLLSFDTEGNVQAQKASDLLTGSVLGANYTKASHTGDGTIVAFSTTEAAGSKNNIQVYIDGVYQNKDTFSISGSTLTFTEAPPLNSAIEFIVGNAVTSLTTDPAVVAYNQGGTGAQDRTLTSRLQDFVSVKDFGAVGDGVTDDTAAIQAALDYAYQNISSDTYNPGSGPTRSVGQLPVYIPAGSYLISSPLSVYGGTQLIGAGMSATVIKSTTTMAALISLVGVTFASSTDVQQTEIRDLSLNGGYTVDFGLTNAVTEDYIALSSFKNLAIYRTKEVGLFITGCASSFFENIQVLNSNIGIIFGRNSSGNGFNLNTVIRCDAQSCNRIGMYLDVQTCQIVNPNIDKIGTSWLPNPNFDVTKTFSYKGIDYTQFSSTEIDHPIGMYVTGITKDTVIDGPWFEFVYDGSGNGVAVEFNGSEAYGNGFPLMAGNEVNQLHVGASVDQGFKIEWSQVKLTAPHLTNATTKLTLGSSQYARVILDNWYYTDINEITTGDTQNRIRSINTSGFGDGVLDDYYFGDTQEGVVDIKRFQQTVGGATYTNDLRTIWEPSDYRVAQAFSHYNGALTTTRRSLSFRGDLAGIGYVSMPQNVGAFNITTSVSTTKTVSFNFNNTTRDVAPRPVVLIVPTNGIGATLIAGGYWIDNYTGTSFDVHFNVVNGNPAYFNFFVVDNDGYTIQ